VRESLEACRKAGWKNLQSRFNPKSYFKTGIVDKHDFPVFLFFGFPTLPFKDVIE